MIPQENKKETIDWEKVEALGYNRATRLRKIEHVLASAPAKGLTAEDLCLKIGLSGSSKIRTLQNDLTLLRELYLGKQEVTRAPYRLLLKGGDLAFPEAEFTTNDRRLLNSICRLVAFFDGAVPVKDILNVSITEAQQALKEISDSIDVTTNGREMRYIKDIFDAIERRYVLDIVYPRLNGGVEFAFAPYLLKRFNNKWFLIGRMYIENPFEWTVIPLASISILSPHKGDYKYLPQKEYEISALKNRIRKYYDLVLGFHVPTNETDLDKMSRILDPEKLETREIRIKCTPKALRFIKENPIHPNQIIKTEELEVRLYLVINPLLVQRILGFGDEIEIISPWELRNTLKDTAAKMACLYNSK